jgi:hypothetical protein
MRHQFQHGELHCIGLLQSEECMSGYISSSIYSAPLSTSSGAGTILEQNR